MPALWARAFLLGPFQNSTLESHRKYQLRKTAKHPPCPITLVLGNWIRLLLLAIKGHPDSMRNEKPCLLLKSLGANASADCSLRISDSPMQDRKDPVHEARKLGNNQFISQLILWQMRNDADVHASK